VYKCHTVCIYVNRPCSKRSIAARPISRCRPTASASRLACWQEGTLAPPATTCATGRRRWLTNFWTASGDLDKRRRQTGSGSRARWASARWTILSMVGYCRYVYCGYCSCIFSFFFILNFFNRKFIMFNTSDRCKFSSCSS